MADLRSGIRKAVVTKLSNDAAMKTLFPLNIVAVSYRPTRKAQTLPRITFFDFGDRADDSIPLWEHSLQFDVWDGDLDKCEAIAQRIIELLDHASLDMPGDEGFNARLHVVSNSDSSQEDGDLVRKSLRFRVLSYDYVTPYTVG